MDIIENEGTKLNLIPTSKINDCKPILDGNVSSNKLQVALGDDFKKDNFNPDKLVDELARVDVDELEFTEKSGDPIYTLKTNVSTRWKDKIKEVGLYFKKPNVTDESQYDWVLVAYYSQEDFLYNPETLSLRLMLPYKEKRRDTSSGNNPEQKNNLKSSSLASPRLGNAVGSLASAWDTLKKKQYVWSEEFTNQVAIYSDDRKYANEPITNIAARFDGANSAYLLFKGKYSSNVYVRIYDFPNNRLSDPFFSTELTTILHSTDGIFGQLKQREVKAYVSHPTGVWCLTIDLAGQLRSVSKQQYHASTVGKDSTVYNLDDNAGLAGGNVAGNTSGNMVSACGREREGLNCLGAQAYITYKRDNPVVIYWDEKVYFFGGNRNLSESAIEIRPVKMKSDGTFNYFSELAPQASIVPKINGPLGHYHFLKTINADTHVSCIIEGKIFLFPRDIFKNEEDSPFFIYDIFTQALSSNYLPTELQEKVQEGKIKKYDSLQVISVYDQLAYFFLTTSTRNQLATRVISLNIKP